MTAEELERVLRATQETSGQSGRPHMPVLLRGSSLRQDDADQDNDPKCGHAAKQDDMLDLAERNAVGDVFDQGPGGIDRTAAEADIDDPVEQAVGLDPLGRGHDVGWGHVSSNSRGNHSHLVSQDSVPACRRP